MTISIEVTNYRGCESARIECNPIALVAGRNAAGKTSLAQGVGNALCGKLSAPGGLPRNPGGLLVRTGAGSASIEVRGGDGVARMVWPSGQASAEGKAPTASEWAAGIDSIVYLPARDRARVLSDLLHAEPTKEDLDEALAERGMIDLQSMVWHHVQGHGWDGAHGLWKETGTQLKGEWRGVTGVNYGSRVGGSWRPDLAGLDEHQLVMALSYATSERDRAITAEALSEAEHHRAEQEADLLKERRAALAEADRAVADAERVFALAREQRASLPPAEHPHTVPCPYCHEPIAVERDMVEVRLAKVTKLPDDKIVRDRRRWIAEADGKMAHAQDALNIARKDVAGRAALVEASMAAQERLENWPRAVEQTISRREAEIEIVAAEKRLVECRAKLKADTIHEKIEAGEAVMSLLAPDGLRAAKLARVLQAFEASMWTVAGAAGWLPVTISPEMIIHYGGRAYALLSASEQFRLRVILQVAMAKLEGASLVVIDGADILDGPARGGLFALLAHSEIPALVCMTLSRIEQMPDLADSALGLSYWIEGGVIEPEARAA